MELLLKARPSRGDRDADAGPCWRPVHRGGLLRPGPRMPSPIRLSLGEALRRPAGEPRGGRARAEVEAHRPDAKAFAHPAPAVAVLIRNSKEVAFGSPRHGGAARERLNLRLTLQQPASRAREQRVYSQAKEGVRVAEQGLRAAEDRILLRVAADYLAVLQGDALLGRDAVAGVGTEAPAGFPEPPAGRRGDRGRRAAAVSAVKWRRTAAGLAHREREAAAVVRRPRSDGEVEVLQPGVELTSPRLRNCSPAPTETRADVHQARAYVVAELEVAKQKGAYLPVVTADAGYVWQRRRSHPALRLRSAPLHRAPLAVRAIGARVATVASDNARPS